MKKILFLTEGQKISGPATWATGLINHLRKKGYPVTEINALSFLSLLQIFRTSNYDVIHAYHISGTTLLFLTYAKLIGRKIIFTLHGNYFEEFKSKKGLKKLLSLPFHNYLLAIADAVTFPSKFLYQKIIYHKPHLSDKSIVIHNGVENINYPSRPTTSTNICRLLMVTNFNYLKKAEGIVPVINAFGKLIKIYPQLTLDILGDGKYTQTFIDKYQQPGLAFLGRQPAAPLLQDCGIFIHSTYLDNLPYVILEAMQYHKPIITVPTGGIPEMVDSSSLVDIDPFKFSEKIKSFINDSHLRKLNIQKNVELLSGFFWKNIIEDFIDIYEI
jgi:glycosyltransferase involved in cell wall biosynthesis